MRKFILDGWVPRKLDVFLDAPDVLDISNLRAKGGVFAECECVCWVCGCVLHMRKFILDGWVPRKLDVFLDAPDMLDISNLRAKGGAI